MLPTPIATVSYEEFLAKLLPELVKTHGGKMLFTDGYVFGGCGKDFSSITDNGIDTSVPGGDSSYHYTGNNKPSPTTPIHLTVTGFYVDKSIKPKYGANLPHFEFLTRIPPPNITTLGELADHLKKNPSDRILEGDFEDSAKTFKRKGKKIEFGHIQHYEDIEGEEQLLPEDHPLTVEPDGTLNIQNLPDDCGYCTGDGVYRYYAAIQNVWAPLIAQGLIAAKKVPTLNDYKQEHTKGKPDKGISARWADRVQPKLAQGLKGTVLVEDYIKQYGKGIQPPKLIALAKFAETQNEAAVAEAFWEKAYRLEHGQIPTLETALETIDRARTKAQAPTK